MFSLFQFCDLILNNDDRLLNIILSSDQTLNIFSVLVRFIIQRFLQSLESLNLTLKLEDASINLII